jgi:hypothetical protein
MAEPPASVQEIASKPATLFEAVRDEIMPKYENARDHVHLCSNGTQFTEDGAGMLSCSIRFKTRFRNGQWLYCFIYFVVSILKLGFKINDNIFSCMNFETWCKNESNLFLFCYRESLLRQEA